MWARSPPRSALALSGHCGLWPGWGTEEVAAHNLGWKAQVDAEGQGDDGSEGWGIPLGWNSVKGAVLEVGFPQPVEPKKPQQPWGVPGSRKASEHHLSGLHFNPGTLEGWAPWERPLSVDYAALFAPITFIKQLLMYLSGPMLRMVLQK